MKSTARLFITAAMLLAALGVQGRATALDAEPQESVVATFEGKKIRLADGWEEARACHSDEVGTRCYRTESQMNEAEGLERTSLRLLADCASSVRLYQNTSHGLPVLSLSIRSTYLNMSTYGFDNATSSYRIGACSAFFFDGSGGGAPSYPGSTSAGASATSMVAGWDNRVSSIYIL